MAPPNPLPEFVYKIVPVAPPNPFPDQFPLSELDAKDGFVHLSVADETPHTSARFFAAASTLWIIKIVLGQGLRENVTWDTPQWPHLQGNFGANDVDSVKAFNRPDGKTWDCEGVMNRSWLE